ncbi:MAG: hypothetical protein KC731_09705 [Myxococcales bacterium]|nr:hypothetical protein [Myxococcales bacterium]
MSTPDPKAASYVDRVLKHDSTRKGAAAAAAGVLIAVISEALWPSSS